MTPRPLPVSALRDRLHEAGLLVETRGVEGAESTVIVGASQDSRSLRTGEVFLAWVGGEWDAHAFVPQAVARGAGAVVVERALDDVAVPQLVVTDGRRAAALLSDALQGSPWRAMTVVGITGTNGKTTTALLARHLLAARGPACAMGTLGVVGPDGGVLPGTEGLTTPGPVELAGWLRTLADGGARTVCMEASSHALEQHRLDGVRFQVAAFTNLSQDHLDYHGSMALYREAKLRLLDLLTPGATVVVNDGDPAWSGLHGRRAEGHAAPRRLRFRVDADVGAPSGKTPSDGLAPQVELRAVDVAVGATGSTFRLVFDGEEAAVRLPLPGGFNVENALAAAGIALALGLSLDEVARGLDSAPQVPGRMEVVTTAPPRVLIDFAHTPEALERVLDTLRPLVAGRLLVVFGAGGDRDRGKRPHMGAAVEGRADLALVTSDNPRTEDPERIVDDIVAGMTSGRYERVVDRRSAIARALSLAGPDDLVLLAGKGHERTQTIGREKIPFDERVIVRDLLDGRAA